MQLKTKQEKNADNILKSVENFYFSTKHIALPLFWCQNEMASGQKTGNRVISIKSVTMGWSHFLKGHSFLFTLFCKILYCKSQIILHIVHMCKWLGLRPAFWVLHGHTGPGQLLPTNKHNNGYFFFAFTVKSQTLDRSTIQFWNILAKGHST